MHPSKKFIEVVPLITKILLGSNSEKSQEYTFEKNSLKPFGYFEPFLSVYYIIFNNLRLNDLKLSFFFGRL